MGRIINDNVGIEKINVYPTSLKLDLSELASQRGYDIDHMHNDLMVYERGVNPTWEDPVTMAVNAAKDMLSEEDKSSIGLLILCTETGLDLEKPLSSWVLRYLELPTACRHFEVKCACYSGTAALKMALSWVQTNLKGKKALVITTDQSLSYLNKPWEYVGGAGAVAMLISNQPEIITISSDKYGLYSHEVADVIRPLPWIETGNSEDSLFSYMEGLAGSFDNYLENNSEFTSFDDYFNYNVYHVPFSGISYRAHKQLLTFHSSFKKEDILKSFNRKTKPSLMYPQRIGGTYGGGVYIALTSLIAHAADLREGDVLGIFSYGSGSCAEFYQATVCKNAKKYIKHLDIDGVLDRRYSINVSDYEFFENRRIEMIKSENFSSDISQFTEIYKKQYEGKNKLIYLQSKGYYRHYEFS